MRVAAFIEKYNELKNILQPDEVILFGDNAHPQHQTKLTYGWIKKGERKSEKMTACQKHIKAFAEQLCKAYPHASTIH